jgi:hypothetical protein
MAVAPPVLDKQANIRIEGDNSGPIVIGDNNAVISESPGARIVHVTPTGPTPTHPPDYVLPRRFRTELVDRHKERQLAKPALAGGRSVEFYGPDGVGKSILLHHLAADSHSADFRDGIVTLSALNRNAEDIGQAIFDLFYRYDDGLPRKLSLETLSGF